MKFVTFVDDDEFSVGVLSADERAVHVVPGTRSPSGDGLVRVIQEWSRYEEVARQARDSAPVTLATIRLAAPLPRPPRNIFCVGKNYVEHAAEFDRSGFDRSRPAAAAAQPARPIFFTKAPSSVIAPGAVIETHDQLSRQVDYEAEFAAIIGPGGRAISRDRATEHVWGYTIVNDVTARDLQRDHQQWFLGKSLDTFCPMGPWAVTADEVDIASAVVSCQVNGELRQQAVGADLIFDVPTLIETLSAGITLQPADIIATGTPAGVGIGFDPPRFLVPGDEICVEVTGLGRLCNTFGSVTKGPAR